MKQNWILTGSVDKQLEEELLLPGLSSVFLRILRNRGLDTREGVEQFLYPEMSPFHSPFLMKGMENAVERICHAIADKEKIAIFADSDLDGITSLTILHDLLSNLGADLYIRYPRAGESYGLSKKIIDEFLTEEINLAITVDSGIRDVAEIAYAVEGGIDFIVTDHHEPDEILPHAIVINPKQHDCQYPCSYLAGVGVAFKLAKAIMFSHVKSLENRYYLIYRSGDNFSIALIHRCHVSPVDDLSSNELLEFLRGLSGENTVIFCNAFESAEKLKTLLSNIKVLSFSEFMTEAHDANFDLRDFAVRRGIRLSRVEDEFSLFSRVFLHLQLKGKAKLWRKIDYYSSLATLGTIADMVPLKGENRAIVKHGLEVLNGGEGHLGIGVILGNKVATAKSLSWDVAPMLNSPGRLGQTEATVSFFLEKESSAIEDIIRELNGLNRQRRGIVSDAIERIMDNCDNLSDVSHNLFYHHDEEIPEGVSGLVANRIADIINKPVIILSNSSVEDCLKGSGRCPDGLNFFEHIEKFSSHFERLGGHAQAFGFTLHNSRVTDIMEKVNQSLAGTAMGREYQIDHVLNIGDITMKLIDEIMLLEPYGKDNPEPIFCSKDIKPRSFNRFGATQNHGKFFLQPGLEVIGWDMGDIMEEKFSSAGGVDLLYKIEKNEYMNNVSIRLVLIDID